MAVRILIVGTASTLAAQLAAIKRLGIVPNNNFSSLAGPFCFPPASGRRSVASPPAAPMPCNSARTAGPLIRCNVGGPVKPEEARP